MRYRLIYVFRINDKAHNGCLKIGEATAAPDTRATTPPDAPALQRSTPPPTTEFANTPRRQAWPMSCSTRGWPLGTGLTAK